MKIFNRKNSGIGNNSIKESIDTMPMGLCFYYDYGMPVLVNDLMNELCIKITGKPLQNGQFFAENVSGKVVKIGEEFYKFTNEKIEIKKKNVSQLTAINVTELYKYSEDLEEENSRLRDMNDRLREYEKNVEELTRNEEILNAKIRIHDNLGGILLETKLAVKNGRQDYTELIEKWKNTVNFLQNTDDADNKTDYNSELKKTAEALGVSLIINGDINGNRLYISAVKESVVNAVKHSDAKQITVFEEQDKLAVITDGRLQKDGIKESGGLLNLRKMAELNGYKMTVSTENAYKLTIERVTQ